MPQSNGTNENMSANTGDSSSRLVFRYSYVLLPCLIALVCIILALVFYNRMPAELGLRFASDGTPKTLMNRNTFVALMLGLQVGIVATASLVAVIFLKIARYVTRNSPAKIDISGFIALMSNMLLLPQIILGYIMLDAFVYGLNATHIFSLVSFSLTVIGIGTVILFILFGYYFKQMHDRTEKKKEQPLG
jgi:uncharacterized membrane protein